MMTDPPPINPPDYQPPRRPPYVPPQPTRVLRNPLVGATDPGPVVGGGASLAGAELAELRDRVVALDNELRSTKSAALGAANLATHRLTIQAAEIDSLKEERDTAVKVAQAAQEVALQPCEHTDTLARWYFEVDHYREQAGVLAKRLTQLGESTTVVEYGAPATEVEVEAA